MAAGTTAAKLLVTNVINHAIPLIRYELADELTVLAEPNPGPWTGRRIADIEGRVEGTFVYDGDVEIHLHLFRSALGRRRQMLEYQVRQTPAGADIAVRTSAPLDTDALSRELVEALTELGVARPQVSVTEVEEIERTGSTGKTGHDAQGRSVVLSDGPTPRNHENEFAIFHELGIRGRCRLRRAAEREPTERPCHATDPNGTIVRITVIKAGEHSPMHRTESIDYGIVL